MVMPIASLLMYMSIIYSISSGYATCSVYADSTNLKDWLQIENVAFASAVIAVSFFSLCYKVAGWMKCEKFGLYTSEDKYSVREDRYDFFDSNYWQCLTLQCSVVTMLTSVYVLEREKLMFQNKDQDLPLYLNIITCAVQIIAIL